MWLGALGIPGAQRPAWAAVGLLLLGLSACASEWAYRRGLPRAAARARVLRFGWVLLVASARTVPSADLLDVPRRTESWFWSDGGHVISDSSGLRLRCYDTLAPGFAYRLRVELYPLDSALAPWAFDAVRAAAPRGILARARVAARLGRVPRPEPWWRRAAGWGRARIRQLDWGPAARGLALAMWIGDLDDLPEASMHAYQALGLIHVLSVSGFHLGLLWMGVAAAARGLPRRLRPGAMTAGIAAIWAFVAVVDFAPSAVRSAAMITVTGAALVARGRGMRALDAFAWAQVGLLAWAPEYAQLLSFQLSTAAVLGLIVASPPTVPGTPVTRRAAVLAGLRTSLAAQWATTALSLNAFHTVPLAFLLTNALLVPPLMLVYPCSLAALAGIPVPDPEPLLAALESLAADPRWVWSDRFLSPTSWVLVSLLAAVGLWGLRTRNVLRVSWSLALTALLLARSGPQSLREQRWVAVGRGLACVQVRADSAQIFGTRYLIENEFIWNSKLNLYFRSRGVRYCVRRVRPWSQLHQQKRAAELREQERGELHHFAGFARIVNP
jgi:ComEC/Rec2-related protein